MMTNLEHEMIQRKATRIMIKLMKLVKHKNNICVCPILDKENDKEEFYQFAFLSHLDKIKNKYPDFCRISIDEALNKFDFVIIYNGIRNAGKYDIDLKIINT